ncbi:MAG TPA: UDP-phosphate galactose phosphotransferase [Rhodobacteraceae bacterium]|nr:UDP-phosphate galactose phosphotransferase [Paracoccaceae bacterium]
MTFEAGPLPTGEAVRVGRPAPRARVRDISFGKLVFDKVFAAFALFTLAPVLAAIAIANRFGDRGPVFYKHKRIGQNGKPFYCVKFRSMRVDSAEVLAELLDTDPAARIEWERDQKLTDDPRIHPVGRFLRKTSLDELPQFWNVLKGDMSIVGPRPIIGDEAQRYGHHFADYCAVRPGITGAWQVGGRNLVSYDERVALDVDYVRNATLLDDFRIVLKTFAVVLTQEGAS